MDDAQEDVYTDAKFARLYSKFRPGYSDTIFDKILWFCQKSGSGFNLAIDVGCGPGQSTLPLAKFFKKVIGVDVSEAQISNAPKDIPNVSFKVSPGEDLGFVTNESVDLVTVATAFHYLDPAKFLIEVDRVLKPSGCLVIYCYRMPSLSNHKADAYLQHLMDTEIYDQFTARERTGLNDYRNVQFPYEGMLREDNLSIKVDSSLEDFVGVMSSWTFFRALQRKQPHRQILDEMRENFLKCVDEEEGLETKVTVTYKVFMLMFSKPA